LGVVAAGLFCLSLFMALFLLGSWMIGAPLYPGLLIQHFLLQALMILVLTSLCFLLSLMVNPDAAFTFAVLYAVVSSILANVLLTVYDYSAGFARLVITGLTWLLPQLMLFDLSEKYVHGDLWDPISVVSMLQLALYALVFTVVFLVLTWTLFRRRSL